MSGAAIHRLVRSGWVMAHALGACSPNTTCRNETSDTATVDATPPRARNSGGGGSVANQSRDTLAAVSSATFPPRLDAAGLPRCPAERWRWRRRTAARTVRALL